MRRLRVTDPYSIEHAATITDSEAQAANARFVEERADARTELDRAFAESQLSALCLITISPARVYAAGCACSCAMSPLIDADPQITVPIGLMPPSTAVGLGRISRDPDLSQTLYPGQPIGITFVGRANSEASVVRIGANAFQRAIGPVAASSVFTPAVPSDD